MLLWLVPLISGVGFLAFRSWQQDLALRSGELMDVREVLPSGDVDLEVRALGARRYRLELQFESSTELRGDGKRSYPPAAFPYRLSVEALGEGDRGAVLFEQERELRDLMGLASHSRESTGSGSEAVQSFAYWGNIPLVEFESSTLGRVRFEFRIEPTESGTDDGAAYDARFDKAWLILKEDVRTLRLPSGTLETVWADLQAMRIEEASR